MPCRATTTARGGHDIRLTPAMWHAADRWFADKFALTDLLLREAEQGRTGKSDSQNTASP